MADYDKIKTIRSDMTDWILHLTKSFDLLKQILRDGYLKPGLAPRKSFRDGKVRPTVRGPHPAVCFSEMPLWAVKALTDEQMATPRYFPFGFAFEKKRLFDRVSARPVIYSKEEVLGRELEEGEPGYILGHRIHTTRLPSEMQYLWVRLDLDSSPPTDWTHEREWRSKVDANFPNLIGLPGVPLELGTWRQDRPTNFKVIVKTSAQEGDVRQLVSALPAQAPVGVDTDYWAAYVARMRLQLDVVVLDQVVGPSHRTGRVETYF